MSYVGKQLFFPFFFFCTYSLYINFLMRHQQEHYFFYILFSLNLPLLKELFLFTSFRFHSFYFWLMKAMISIWSVHLKSLIPFTLHSFIRIPTEYILADLKHPRKLCAIKVIIKKKPKKKQQILTRLCE